MKRAILVLAALAVATPAAAQVHVRGHFRSDGTYVPPHVRSAPNNSRLDNYSTYPNVNPYTGRQGTQNPYPQPRANTLPSYPTQRAQRAMPRTPSPPTCPRGSFLC